MPPPKKIKLEYIWIDGTKPTKKLRSKTKIVSDAPNTPEECPQWGFDGSSTGQAKGEDSDCQLHPCFVCADPIRGDGSRLVLCAVHGSDGLPHATNRRSELVEVAERHASEKALFGIEQEYTMFKGNRPLGWPESGYPAPQGPFYCGVGSDEVFGRDIVERHMDVCLEAGLEIAGINAEVMPGQWEFQIGPLDALSVSDQLIIARWLLFRCAEDSDVTISLDPKPVRGDWNGAGAHTNFSTAKMRGNDGLTAIHKAIARLKHKADLHIRNYGDGIEQRLTGQHETASHETFRSGVADRGASIRIPRHVETEQRGYFEDRRPCANIDPYLVTRLLLETILD